MLPELPIEEQNHYQSEGLTQLLTAMAINSESTRLALNGNPEAAIQHLHEVPLLNELDISLIIGASVLVKCYELEREKKLDPMNLSETETPKAKLKKQRVLFAQILETITVVDSDSLK